MERISLNTKQSSFSLFVLPHIFIYRIIVLWVIGVNRLWSSLQSQLQCYHSKVWEEKKQTDFGETYCSDKNRDDDDDDDDDDDGILQVEMVMERLGLCCSKESEEEGSLEWIGSEERVLGIFEVEEPSLEEVKEAFDVFDFNRDGFIDAMELQRVLQSLGFKEGLEIDRCREMIRTHDQNGDGVIDFKEFLRFMERSFC